MVSALFLAAEVPLSDSFLGLDYALVGGFLS
jgi:hypothetical protein